MNKVSYRGLMSTVLLVSALGFAADATVKEEAPGLFKRAKITAQAAMTTAHAKVPNATIAKAILEEHKGVLHYTFEMKVEGKAGTEEVQVDALSGQILSMSREPAHDTPKDKKSEEHEKKTEEKEKKDAGAKPPMTK